MDIEMKVQILRACSSKKGSRCSSCPAFGHGKRNCIRNAMKDAADALSTLQAENEKLRNEVERQRRSADDRKHLYENAERAYMKVLAELERVTAERDAVIKELNGVSSLVDDLAEFVDREIHPVVDYNLYLDLRENVDAVSMFQHEDEWRGLHKEE